jgi:hypothetical protein
MNLKIKKTKSVFGSLFCLVITSFTSVYGQSGQLGFSSIITDARSTGTISYASSRIIEDIGQNWSTNEWAGYYIHISGPDGSNQIRRIISNTAKTITVTPALNNIPEYNSGFSIRRGYKASTHGLKLKLYMQFNDANRPGGKLIGYSCRIQASDSSAVEFVSVEQGSGLSSAWAPSYFAPPGTGQINWLVIQFPETDQLASGFYHIATVTFNLLKTDIDKPITFFVTNCPDGGLPKAATVDRYRLFFDTTTNNTLSGREEIFVLQDTPEDKHFYSAQTSEVPSIIGSYPNPFNPTTTIQYELSEHSDVQLVVYDIRGRVVSELVNSHQYEGLHSVGWEPQNMASGTYFAHVNIKGSVSNQNISKSIKLVFTK